MYDERASNRSLSERRPGAVDITNQKFGPWLALRPAPRPAGTKQQGQHWLCRCDCGTEVVLPGSRLRCGGLKRGCGKCTGHGHASRLSGLTPTYNSWRAMKERCLNPNHKNYSAYGGRGIQISSRWLDFANFLSDMGQRPKEATLDRIDTNGHYEPGNCRWARQRQQVHNSSSCKLSDEQVCAIRDIAALGAKPGDIAILAGISPAYVNQIVSGRARDAG